ncbi:putative glutamine-rich protein 2 isoform X1 [Apostichopus japonicus]|uniref:Putative glutamine-rich protein 2 isoform X1 n=1 Tax=Stichopus japonicus TaxID=307972 RepID=A0A2G8KDK5_STIJA|nr:putative glutamine-rich protein 2 isoform X1 [Apostichopus japonicus]
MPICWSPRYLEVRRCKSATERIRENRNFGRKDGEVSDRLSRVPSTTTSSSEVLELEKKVSQLETKLDSLNQLPSNENLMHRVRSHDSTDSQAPVSEMWQLMQVQKKAQTNEEGISKLMSMVEHLMGEFQDVKKDVDGMKQQMEKFNSEISNLQEQMNSVDQNNSALMERLKKVEAASSNQDKMNELQKFMNDLNNKISSLPPIELIVTWPAMEDALKGIYKETTVSTVVSHNGMQTAPMTDTSKIQTMPTTHAYAQTMS